MRGSLRKVGVQIKTSICCYLPPYQCVALMLRQFVDHIIIIKDDDVFGVCSNAVCVITSTNVRSATNQSVHSGFLYAVKIVPTGMQVRFLECMTNFFHFHNFTEHTCSLFDFLLESSSNLTCRWNRKCIQKENVMWKGGLELNAQRFGLTWESFRIQFICQGLWLYQKS